MCACTHKMFALRAYYIISLFLTLPLSRSEGCLTSVYFGGKDVVKTQDMYRWSTSKEHCHDGIGSFAVSIFRRPMPCLRYRTECVQKFPVTQQVIPLLLVYYPSHARMQGHCAVVLWYGRYHYILFLFLEHPFAVS